MMSRPDAGRNRGPQRRVARSARLLAERDSRGIPKSVLVILTSASRFVRYTEGMLRCED